MGMAAAAMVTAMASAAAVDPQGRQEFRSLMARREIVPKSDAVLALKSSGSNAVTISPQAIGLETVIGPAMKLAKQRGWGQ